LCQKQLRLSWNVDECKPLPPGTLPAAPRATAAPGARVRGVLVFAASCTTWCTSARHVIQHTAYQCSPRQAAHSAPVLAKSSTTWYTGARHVTHQTGSDTMCTGARHVMHCAALDTFARHLMTWRAICIRPRLGQAAVAVHVGEVKLAAVRQHAVRLRQHALLVRAVGPDR
jgi:hypothetical protein